MQISQQLDIVYRKLPKDLTQLMTQAPQLDICYLKVKVRRSP